MKVENDGGIYRGTGVGAGNGSEGPRKQRRSHWWILMLAVATAVLLVIAGILPRIQARTALRRETAEMAVPTVAVVQAKHSAPAQEIILPANVQAFADAPIYARTSGYLKRWYVDIGSHVKQGHLLAEIDTPEVNQQLRQARADLATAQANLNLSKITADRYEGLLKTDSVSKQESDNAAGDFEAKQAALQSSQANLNLSKITADRYEGLLKTDSVSKQESDNASGDFEAKQAALQSSQANVKRLEELQSFQKIYAPFSGVITARNTDIGALINSGSSGGNGNELFHIAQPDKLRVYVSVPQAYSQAAKPGLTADLTLAEFPGRRFAGKLVRTANAIDPASRTLLVEIAVDNPTGQLFTGSYAEVHLKLPTAASSLILPVNALLFRSEGLRVATVGQGQKVALKAITLGHDFGNEVEVVAGLNGDENVIVNPPDSVVEGETVRIAQGAQ